MTRITNSDQVLVLLRAQLKELERTRRQDPAAPTGRVAPRIASSQIDRVRALAGDGQIKPEDIKAALIQGLLVDALGAQLANDPGLLSVARSVGRIIDADEESRQLLDAALSDLIAD